MGERSCCACLFHVACSVGAAPSCTVCARTQGAMDVPCSTRQTVCTVPFVRCVSGAPTSQCNSHAPARPVELELAASLQHGCDTRPAPVYTDPGGYHLLASNSDAPRCPLSTSTRSAPPDDGPCFPVSSPALLIAVSRARLRVSISFNNGALRTSQLQESFSEQYNTIQTRLPY